MIAIGPSSVDRLARSKRPIVERTEIHIPPAPQLSPEAITGPTPNRLAAVARFNADLQKWRNDAWAVEMPGQPDFALQTDVATLRDDTKEMIAQIQTNTINITNIQTDITNLQTIVTNLQTSVTNIDNSITNITNATATGSGIVQANGTGNPQTAMTGTFGYVPYWQNSDPFLSPTSPIYVSGNKIGINTNAPFLATVHVVDTTIGTNSVLDIIRLEAQSSNVPVAGFGAGFTFSGQSDSITDRDMGRIQTRWTIAADATRASAMDFQTVTAAAIATRMTLSPTGGLSVGDSTATTAVGVINAVTGYRVASAAAAVGSFLGGNGTNFVPVTPTAASFPHVMLDTAVHTDTLTATVSRGSLIVGNATPLWSELLVGTVGQYVRTDGSDAAWSNLLGAEITGTIPISTHSHVMLTGAAGVHTDTLIGTVVRGDIFYGNSTPLWARLGVGSTSSLLFVNASSDVAWSNANLKWVEASNSLQVGSPTSINSTIAALTAAARTTSTIGYLLVDQDTSATNGISKTGLYIDATGNWTGVGAGTRVRGVVVLANGSSVENAGGLFTATGSATDSYGVYGNSDASGTNNYGVYGISGNAGATNNYGGYFAASNGLTSNYAIFCNGGKIYNNSVAGIICANAALATNATAGFFYVPTCAGLPTGVPVAETGTCALQFNTTSNKIALYDTKWFQFSPYEVKSYDVADTGNFGIGEDTLRTYTVPANALSDDGDSVEFYAAGTFATSINSKRLRVKFGATTIFDSGALAITTTADWCVEGHIIRTGAATQRCIVTLSTSSGTLSAYADYTTAGETLSGTVALVITGEAVADNDIVCTLWKIMTLGCP